MLACVHPIDPVENVLHATFRLAKAVDWLSSLAQNHDFVAGSTINWTWVRRPYIELIRVFSEEGVLHSPELDTAIETECCSGPAEARSVQCILFQLPKGRRD